MILLDAEYSAAQAVAAGAIPGATGLVVPLEAMGYGDVAKVEQTTFLEGWSPAKARRLGASGAKLLLPYRADVADQAARQEDVVRTAVAGCREAGLALIVEPIVYRRDGEEAAGGGRFAELVVEGARRLARARARRAQAAVPGLGRRLRGADRGLRRADPVGAARRRRERGRDRRPDRGRLPGGVERLHRRAHALRRRARRRPGRVAARARRRTRGRCSSGSPRSPSAWPCPGASASARCRSRRASGTASAPTGVRPLLVRRSARRAPSSPPRSGPARARRRRPPAAPGG